MAIKGLSFALCGVAALTLSTGIAHAGAPGPGRAEPVVAAPVAAPAVPARRDWTGGYAGLSLTLGAASHNHAPAPAFWPNGNGPGLGVLGGFNWQTGATVFGLEAHLGMGRIRGSSTTAVQGATITTNLNQLASLRGRVGFAQGDTLFFASAGLATGQVAHSAGALGSESRRVNGWVAGIGFETALGAGVNLRGDLEHYRFNRTTFTTAGLNFPGVRTSANVARLSVVYRF